jgi:large subunit ribosomal protein L17
MRHNKKINHLGRTKAHREAMLSNMASSLILHKRIFTTTAKAKALRKYVEPLITKSKESSKPQEAVMHSRRVVFASLQNKFAVKELFSTVAGKIGDRPGGYTRIIKTGARLGDNAAMCFIELVDFNENMLSSVSKKTARTRRSRGGKKASADVTAATPAEKVKSEEVAAVQENAAETAVAEAIAVVEEDVTGEATEESTPETGKDAE